MVKLDSKKIDGVLKQLENAAKAGVKALNEMTDGGYKDSVQEQNPLGFIGLIAQTLQLAQLEVKNAVLYEGMTEEQIADAKSAAQEAELAALQEHVQSQLAEMTTPPIVVTEEELEPVEEIDPNAGGTL